MYYIYVLESIKNKETYIGFTNDLKRRFEQHSNGNAISTKSYLPWKLIYYEACLDREDAMRREKYFKKTQGRRLLKRRLKEYFYKQKK
jgi:putative endonuclease